MKEETNDTSASNEQVLEYVRQLSWSTNERFQRVYHAITGIRLEVSAITRRVHDIEQVIQKEKDAAKQSG